MPAESVSASRSVLLAVLKPFSPAAANACDCASTLATLAILLTAYGLVAWIWLASDAAWFHVELFGVSENVWGAQASSFGAKLRALFDWRIFDVSPYRLRIVSDFVEIIDAITRPALRTGLGLHPSATLLSLGIAAAILAIFYAALRRLGLSNVEAALFVLLLATTIGFLSCFVPYIRPAKKLALLCCCIVVYLCLLLQERPTRRLYLALFTTLLLGFFADETGYALLPISLILLARPIILRRGWLELGTFAAVLPLFAALARVVLPYVYSVVGSSGPREETVAGHIVFKLLGYLFEPKFYAIALDDLGTSVMTSFGVVDPSRGLTTAFLVLFFCGTAVPTILFFRPPDENSAIFWNVPCFAVSLVTLSFSLTLFDWFNNPYSSNYIGALTYYYHSAVAMLAVVWLACVWRAAVAIAGAAPSSIAASFTLGLAVAVMAWVNVGHFQDINRLFQILHTYPLDAKAFFGSAWSVPPTLMVSPERRSASITVSANPDALNAEYQALLQRSVGPRAANFQQALNIYQKGPIGTAQFVQRYIRLYLSGLRSWRDG
jgi:hypothetical protein